MAYNDKDGKVVYEGKIDAIKALRILSAKTLPSIARLEDGSTDFILKVGYIGLKEAKDMVESIMALGVSELQKDERFNRNPSNNVFPQYLTEGQTSGYLTSYTLSAALQVAREDKSIEQIRIKESDGSENTLYRNSRKQYFELDII